MKRTDDLFQQLDSEQIYDVNQDRLEVLDANEIIIGIVLLKRDEGDSLFILLNSGKPITLRKEETLIQWDDEYHQYAIFINGELVYIIQREYTTDQ